MEIKNSSQDKRVHNGKISYHVREEYDNGESKDLTVDQAENGYLITIEHYLADNAKKGEKSMPYEERYNCKR